MASIVHRGKAYNVVYSYTDESGIRKQKWETFHSENDAIKRKKEIEYKESIGKFTIPNCTTLKELLTEYVQTHGKTKWAMMTYSNNVSLINNYIIPMLGRMKLTDIRPRILERFYQQLQRTPAAHRMTDPKYSVRYIQIPTIQKIHKLLNSAFNQAVKWGLLESNPVSRTEMPTYKKAERAIWDANTLIHVNEICDDIRLKLCINLAFSCSLRMGEMLGLTWDCVDISEDSIKNETAYVYVKKELQRVSKTAYQELDHKNVITAFPEGKGGSQSLLVLKTPKTESSMRKVFLPDTVAKMLADHKKEQDSVREMLGDEYTDYNLVFASYKGTPVESAKINASFARLIREHNLPKVVFHSLRHSSITYKLKLSSGDIKSVQGDSGHTEAKMVVDQYSHILDDNRKKTAQLMEEAFYQQKGFKDSQSKNADHSEEASPKKLTPEIIEKLRKNPELVELLLRLVEFIEPKR
jgi:integrase